MTLVTYNPEQLDALALRVLDLCSRLRAMAGRCRDQQLPSFPLHDKKTLEWLARLEEWVHKAEADLEMQVIKNRGARRALEMPSQGGDP